MLRTRASILPWNSAARRNQEKSAGTHWVERLEARRLYTGAPDTPSFSLYSAGATSATFSYVDDDASNLTLEMKAPSDTNFHTLASPYSAGSLSTAAGTQTVTVSGLSGGLDYSFRLRADAGEQAAYSAVVDTPTSDSGAAGAPGDFTATSSHVNYYETSTFTWTAASGSVDHYVIEQKYNQVTTPGDDQWQAVATETGTSSNSMYHTYLVEPGRTAEYRIRAVSAGGAMSAPSNTQTVNCTGTLNATPTLNSASFSWDSDGSLTANWTFNSSTHGSFLVLGFTDGNYQYISDLDFGGTNDSTSATITIDDGTFPGDPSMLSSVAIVAGADWNNEIGQSSMSNVIYLENLPSAPATPANLSASTFASGVGIRLLWDNTPSDETDYLVERSSDSGASFSTIGSVSADTTSYTDGTAVSATSYVYRVVAENAGGDSSASNTVVT